MDGSCHCAERGRHVGDYCSWYCSNEAIETKTAAPQTRVGTRNENEWPGLKTVEGQKEETRPLASSYSIVLVLVLVVCCALRLDTVLYQGVFPQVRERTGTVVVCTPSTQVRERTVNNAKTFIVIGRRFLLRFEHQTMINHLISLFRFHSSLHHPAKSNVH